MQGYMGKLLWLARTARPDLSHAATLPSSNVSVWDDVAEKELCRLIGYLETYPDAVLGSVERSPQKVWGLQDLQFKLYVDASLQAPRSYSASVLSIVAPDGYEIPVDWFSRRQKLGVSSSMMAELVAIADGVATFGSLQEMFAGKPMLVLSDSEAALRAIERGHSTTTATYTHAYRLRISVLRDLEDLNLLSFQHVGTKLNKADLLTKVFGRWEFQRLSQLLGVYRTDITASQSDVERVNRIDAEGYVLEEKEAMKKGAPGEDCFPLWKAGGMRSQFCTPRRDMQESFKLNMHVTRRRGVLNFAVPRQSEAGSFESATRLWEHSQDASVLIFLHGVDMCEYHYLYVL